MRAKDLCLQCQELGEKLPEFDCLHKFPIPKVPHFCSAKLTTKVIFMDVSDSEELTLSKMLLSIMKMHSFIIRIKK